MPQFQSPKPELQAQPSELQSIIESTYGVVKPEQPSNSNRLQDKLSERLDYAKIYFQRNRANLFENLNLHEQKQILAAIKSEYFAILLDYFTEPAQVNQQIDRLVEKIFFLNLPVGEIVEIHMALINNIERQLRLEGIDETHVVDYRLTLIDLMAHLCEMYRCALVEV